VEVPAAAEIAFGIFDQIERRRDELLTDTFYVSDEIFLWQGSATRWRRDDPEQPTATQGDSHE
jgi:hypothetical protein